MTFHNELEHLSLASLAYKHLTTGWKGLPQTYALAYYNNKTCCHNGVKFLSNLLIESQKYK